MAPRRKPERPPPPPLHLDAPAHIVKHSIGELPLNFPSNFLGVFKQAHFFISEQRSAGEERGPNGALGVVEIQGRVVGELVEEVIRHGRF